jgi:hypothetical protein
VGWHVYRYSQRLRKNLHTVSQNGTCQKFITCSCGPINTQDRSCPGRISRGQSNLAILLPVKRGEVAIKQVWVPRRPYAFVRVSCCGAMCYESHLGYYRLMRMLRWDSGGCMARGTRKMIYAEGIDTHKLALSSVKIKYTSLDTESLTI